MRVSFITTIFNESSTIEKFIDSIFDQTKMPEEIVIVDGGSTDNTIKKIDELRLKNKNYKGKFISIIKKGNRSIGRNEAIRLAMGDIIVCSDSGNILDKDWVKKITKPFQNKNVDVVAGYYIGIGNTVFQKCVIPYALVMPDKVDSNNFLPATRSVAFRKRIWEKVGGFSENLTHNEDYAFAKVLEKAKAKIVFQKDAIVYWKPRNSFKQAYIMMYRFAYGDAEARIIRPKVVFVFVRYIICILFLLLTIFLQSFFLFFLFLELAFFYLVWADLKNYKYVNEWPAIFILPLLQLVADWAVLKGTILGLFGATISYN
jgi:glycosyltransferase involved in cell wall biosynthesis